MPRSAAELDPDRVRRLILLAGLTQTNAALLAGITPSTLSRALLSPPTRRIGAPALRRLARVLECSIADLLAPEDDGVPA